MTEEGASFAGSHRLFVRRHCSVPAVSVIGVALLALVLLLDAVSGQ